MTLNEILSSATPIIIGTAAGIWLGNKWTAFSNTMFIAKHTGIQRKNLKDVAHDLGQDLQRYTRMLGVFGDSTSVYDRLPAQIQQTWRQYLHGQMDVSITGYQTNLPRIAEFLGQPDVITYLRKER